MWMFAEQTHVVCFKLPAILFNRDEVPVRMRWIVWLLHEFACDEPHVQPIFGVVMTRIVRTFRAEVPEVDPAICAPRASIVVHRVTELCRRVRVLDRVFTVCLRLLVRFLSLRVRILQRLQLATKGELRRRCRPDSMNSGSLFLPWNHSGSPINANGSFKRSRASGSGSTARRRRAEAFPSSSRFWLQR